MNKIIELFGLPRTGKTTISYLLKDYLEHRGYKVVIVHERVSEDVKISKRDPYFNVLNLKLVFEKYQEVVREGYDYVIIDRGVLNALTWVKALEGLNNNSVLKPEDIVLLENHPLLPGVVHAFFFSGSSGVALIRDGITNEAQEGSIMNIHVLDQYVAAYRILESALKRRVGHLTEIDTTTLSIDETLKEILKTISL